MDSDDDCVYLYLDFNDRITPAVFDKDVFMRVANLHKRNPLVQINDLIFKGSYDECIGSNIFFEEIPDPPPITNVFEKETAIHLKPILTQTKILRMQQMKLPKNFTNPNKPIESAGQIDLSQDYPEVLEKLEQGALTLDDIPSKPTESSSSIMEENIDELILEQARNILTQNAENRANIISPFASYEPESAVESCINEETKTASTLETKYEKLKRLASRPVRRMMSPEIVEECEPRFNENYEYHNLECLVLQNCDAFRTVSSAIIEKNLVGAVDLERCALHGIIASNKTENFRNLTPDELNSVLSVDNFENLSLPARYLVLKESLAKMENLIENMPEEEVRETDENGRNVQAICEIFRKLVAALERQISQNSECLHLKPSTRKMDLDDDVYVKYKRSQGDRLNIECPELFTDAEITYGATNNQEKEENVEENQDNVQDNDQAKPSEIVSDVVYDLEDDSSDDGDNEDDEDFAL